MDLISKKVAIEEFEDMVTSVSVYGESAEARYATNARIRFIEKLNNIPSVPAVPLEKLCEFLGRAMTPCIPLNIGCPYNEATREDCGSCRAREAWKITLSKWMEE